MFATSDIRKRLIALVFLVLLPFSSMANLQSTHLQPAKLFDLLPDNCPTPEPFAIAPDGSLTLSCHNYANPMGIAYDGQGSLYVSDVLSIKNGRILKLTFTQESQTRILARTEAIASDINPSGLRYHQGGIYIYQLKMLKLSQQNDQWHLSF